MTIQDVDKEFQKRVLKDMRLMEIRSRAKRGIATFADTAEYNDRISNILGSVLSGRMPSVPNVERVKLCEYMLRFLYNDTNEMCAAVQQTLDKANGIQITPQKAPFPAERVRKIAKSLTDPSVPENTIKRRAKAPVANVSKSFHDDYIRKNAAFRNDAGLDVYIVRMGTGCCKWCSEVSGKYKFGSQPDDIFRRHDNCDCTIIYDNQVLRGKKKSDGSRSKTWEEIPNAPVEYSPTVLSEQDGRELQQRNLSRFRGLTNSSDNDKIRISGAIGGALNPDSERADKHAEQYYEAVRKMQTDVKRIAENIGYSEESIQSIKDFIFNEKHDLGDRIDYFEPDYFMAQSWQRLIDGKNILPHDLTLIKHEKMEKELISQGYSQVDAHLLTSRKYNYEKEAREYYDKINGNNKK